MLIKALASFKIEHLNGTTFDAKVDEFYDLRHDVATQAVAQGTAVAYDVEQYKKEYAEKTLLKFVKPVPVAVEAEVVKFHKKLKHNDADAAEE